jgi:AcrR family transcriptional regulator
MARIVLDRETRRAQLLDAATTVFARRGYRHASITEIIEAAGVARGTFYLYFESKEEVFLALIDRWFEDVERGLEQMGQAIRSPEDCLGMMRDYLRAWFQFFHERRDLCQVVLREGMTIDARFEERMDQLLARMDEMRGERVRMLKEAGIFRADLDIAVYNSCVTGIFRELLCRHILPDPEPDLDALADQIYRLILLGVLSPAVRDHLVRTGNDPVGTIGGDAVSL